MAFGSDAVVIKIFKIAALAAYIERLQDRDRMASTCLGSDD